MALALGVEDSGVLFVSYSRLDSGRLGPLTDRLNALGIDYWLDTAKIPVGEAFVARIGHARGQCQDFSENVLTD